MSSSPFGWRLPTAGRAPESAADVRDPDADLDREWPGQRLADGDAVAHLFPGQPLLFSHELSLHLTHQRDGPTKAEHAQSGPPSRPATSWRIRTLARP